MSSNRSILDLCRPAWLAALYDFLKHSSQVILPTFLKISSALPIGMERPAGGVVPMIAINSPSSSRRLQESHSKEGIACFFALSTNPIKETSRLMYAFFGEGVIELMTGEYRASLINWRKEIPPLLLNNPPDPSPGIFNVTFVSGDHVDVHVHH